MKLIKGNAPGDLTLDAQGDDDLHRLFGDGNPEMTEIVLTIRRTSVRDTMTRKHTRYALEKPDLEMEFYREYGDGLRIGVNTRNRLTMEQLTSILDILADTEAHAANIMRDMISADEFTLNELAEARRVRDQWT